jgi:hypothetical protein
MMRGSATDAKRKRKGELGEEVPVLGGLVEVSFDDRTVSCSLLHSISKPAY